MWFVWNVVCVSAVRVFGWVRVNVCMSSVACFVWFLQLQISLFPFFVELKKKKKKKKNPVPRINQWFIILPHFAQ